MFDYNPLKAPWAMVAVLLTVPNSVLAIGGSADLTFRIHQANLSCGDPSSSICIDGSCGGNNVVGMFCSAVVGDDVEFAVHGAYSHDRPFTGVYADVVWDPEYFELVEAPSLAEPATSVFGSGRFFLEPISTDGTVLEGFKWSLGPVTQRHYYYRDAVEEKYGLNEDSVNSKLFRFRLKVLRLPPMDNSESLVKLINGTWGVLHREVSNPGPLSYPSVPVQEFWAFFSCGDGICAIPGDTNPDGEITDEEAITAIVNWLGGSTNALSDVDAITLITLWLRGGCYEANGGVFESVPCTN